MTVQINRAKKALSSTAWDMSHLSQAWQILRSYDTYKFDVFIVFFKSPSGST